MKKDKKLIWTGVATAIGASLCCITPVLALIAGSSGIASSLSWMEPFRPYLILVTIFVLGFAWYQKLKPKTKEEIACACDEEIKPPFMQTKMFLGFVTVFAALMLSFPYYSNAFYPNQEKEIIIDESENIKKVNFEIEGMTCDACQNHINLVVNNLNGIVVVNSSYKNGNAEIQFDKSITSIEEIEKAINSTGYTVVETKAKKNAN